MQTLGAKIVPMSERSHRWIPVDKIRVLNSRDREQSQFEQNVRSIDAIGLQKPIVVNERFLTQRGYYELVCGEGRCLAYKSLGKEMIEAEVVDCDRKKALLMSLVENIARVPPGTIWYAHEMKRMKDCGMEQGKIAAIVGKPESYVSEYIHLVEDGEERLIKGVEEGLFKMAFAVEVAKSSAATIQHVLMDAFDSGMVSSSNTRRVRSLIEMRFLHGARRSPGRHSSGNQSSSYSLTQLKADIGRLTKEKEGFVNESSIKETRLLTLIDGLATLWQDNKLVCLLESEGLGERPVLTGSYSL